MANGVGVRPTSDGRGRPLSTALAGTTPTEDGDNLDWDDGGLGPGTVGGDGSDDQTAAEVPYDNSESGLDATNVQDAIDEIVSDLLDGGVDTVGSITHTGTPADILNDTTWNEFPGLARLDATRVLCVFRGNGTDHHSNGQVCGMVGTLSSTHDSVTWGSKFTILDDGVLDLRLEDGVSIVDGQLVVAYRTFDGSDNHNPRLLICADLPADFTETSSWTTVDLPDPGGTVQEYTQGHVSKTAAGTFICGGGYDSGGTHTVGVFRWTASLDDPSAATFVVIGSGAGDFQEISVQPRADGTLLALLRRGASSNTYYSTSSDDGVTWSAVASAHDGYGYPMWRELLSGLVLTVYRDSPNGDTMWRVSTNGGTTYGSETLLDSTGTRNAYASLLQTTNNDILCVYGIEWSSDGSTGTADLRDTWFSDSSTFSGGSFAPPDVDYLVGTASGSLSNEIVVGTTPGGELGGTWASPTVDATHAGSTHIALSSATPLVASGSGSAGSGTAASKDDHVHPATSSGGIGALLISDTPSTPLIFADLIQNEAQDDLVYADT